MSDSAAIRLGERIKAIRKTKGLTQAQVAERCGYDPVTISRFERGDYAPGIESLDAIGRVLDVPISAFFTFESEAASAADIRHRICDLAYGTNDPALLAAMLKAMRKITGS
ncbi:helix-turn-helix domain-containing protein [Pseudomonas aeruginosa]|uniref:helix-turn-helix domain-containing protein n=1 Tax=Pseudomonas aeruginosa TaxID=287 RepID=UPI003D9B21BA